MNPAEFLDPVGRGSDQPTGVTSDNAPEIIPFLLEKGCDLRKRGDHLEAVDCFEQALILARQFSYRDYEFIALSEIGRARVNVRDYTGARDIFEKALSLAESNNEQARIADCLLDIASLFHKQMDYPQAIVFNRRALAVSELDSHTAVLIHLNLGKIYSAQGDSDQALEEFKSAEDLSHITGDEFGIEASHVHITDLQFAQTGEVPSEDLIRLVAALEHTAKHAFDGGDNHQALESYTKCLNIFRSIGNIEATAAALRNIGQVHANMGDYPTALDCYHRGLELYQSLRHHDGIARSHQLIAAAHEEQAQYSIALDHGIKALGIASSQHHPGTLALCLITIGQIYRGQGHYGLALGCHKAALEIARDSGDGPAIAACLNNIGLTWWYRGDHQQALAFYHEALEKNRQLRNPTGMAVCFNNIAAVYHLQCEFSQALKHYNAALTIDRQLGRQHEVAVRLGNIAMLMVDGTEDLDKAQHFCQEGLDMAHRLGDHATAARCLLTLGTIHSKRCDFPSSLRSYAESLGLYREIGEPYGIIRCLQNLGSTSHKQGRYIEALNYYDEAITLARATGDADSLANCLANQGYTWIELNNPQRAHNSLVQSIETIEQLRHWAGPGRRTRIGRFEAFIGPYVALVERILWPKGDYWLAWEYVERLKARTLVELLAEKDLVLSPEVPQELVDEYYLLRRRQRELAFSVEQKFNHGVGFASDVWAERRDIDCALSAIEDQIEKYQPGFHDSTRVRPVTIGEIRAALPDERTVMIEFFLGTTDTLVFIVTKDEPIRSIAVPTCTTADVVQLADQWSSAYREFLLTRDTDDWRACMDEVLSALHSILFAAIEPALPPEGIRLIFIPHQAFHLFPLHAMYRLENGKREYLIERYEEVSYCPSAAVFIRCRQRQRPAPTTLVAVENPTGDLDFAESEVEAVAALFPRAVILGPRRNVPATKQNLIREARDAHVVLCTGHSSSGDAGSACFLLSGEAMTLIEQFAHLDLPKCSIWDYDTCETGLPKINISDEWITLASAPLYAGARSVWSSLWIVDDFSTAQLKQLAYQNFFKNGLNCVRALNDAQRSFVHANTFSNLETSDRPLLREEHRHPFYWAGFITSGTI